MALAESAYPELLRALDAALRAGRVARAREILRKWRKIPIYPGLAIAPPFDFSTAAPVRRASGRLETPPTWLALAERIRRTKPRRVVLIGAPDAGKSTLAGYLARRCRAALLDGDLGQSDVGPPGCMGLRLPNGRVEIAFVGSYSAESHLAAAIAAHARLSTRADRAARITITNTDGWVRGSAAVAYKRALSAVAPADLVVAVGEASIDFARATSTGPLVVVEVPGAARPTSGPVRRGLREAALRRYLARARAIRVVAPCDAPAAPRGALVGLLDARGATLAAGVLLSNVRGVAKIRTPLPARSAARVRAIRVGSILLSPSGREIGFVAPTSELR